ncbi:nuclear speckle RNA-binding protein A [Citrus sinensis]|uniref:RRM-containing protein n=1 Tax=Citrus unshiu TaxID=55188 RepID=F8WL76_CITUN|nr:RNA-binding protein 1-like isoform X4 [Citrus sinensis]KAH9653259.1 nuclear speckle RNA-binding protein A [Citrus sinensis]BAK61821.1 RRM-containing protein [Citrus unshiu]
MGDPFHRYDTPADRASSVARPSFAGYLTSEAPSLTSQQPLSSNGFRGASDFLHREVTPMRPGALGLVDTAGVGVHPEPGMVGITAVASVKGYSSPLPDPNLIGQRRDIAPGINPTIPDVINGVPSSLRNNAGSPLKKGESNLLFVDGLPTDCTRREVSRILLNVSSTCSGDRAMVLCFVEFDDPKCARTAMDALHGYKFDDKKPDSPALKIQFAHFPFRLPSDGDEKRTPR